MQDIIKQILEEVRGVWRFRWHALAAARGVCVLGWLVVLIDVGVGYSNNIARTAVNAQSDTISRAGLDFAVAEDTSLSRLDW